jgi:nucleoside-diphosphate-sugar epimerase
MDSRHLLIFGLGYTGAEIARRAVEAGYAVTATSRAPGSVSAPPGVTLVAFADAAPAIATATHVVSTAAPADGRDPVLATHGAALTAAPHLRWAGYLSTTGVYGDRGGGWVDEDTPPAPTGPRGTERVAAEAAWTAALAGRMPVDLFRVAGIYGPGRSALHDVLGGRARRVIKPGHAFGRIHRDDIARAVLAAAGQDRPAGALVLNLADDEPAEQAAVLEEAARLLGVTPPPAVPYDVAAAGMSDMGRSFWRENRKVASAKTQARLGLRWLYPTYREGLRAILAADGLVPDRGGSEARPRLS